MDMTGEYRLATSREAVWQALNDPDVLKQCIPGCQELEKASETEFAATVKAKVGPVSATFSGRVELSDLDPPNGYKISGEGQGGAAGFARGGAEISLTEDDGTTVLHYTVTANVGGKLAQIGSRLIDSTARKMAKDFFGKFAELVAPAAEAEVVAPAETAPAVAPTESPPSRGLRPVVWVAGVIAIVVILVLAFGTG